jgi:hypothetical protein
MAKKVSVPHSTRVPRPQLKPAHAALAVQYRPSKPCACTPHNSPDKMAFIPEWLMEPPVDGQPLQFYCSNCGKYQLVPR